MAEKTKFKWSKLILAASLGLNLIVAGVVAGTFLQGSKRGDRAAGAPSFVSGPFGRALSKDDRRAMGEALRGDESRKGKLDGQRREMRQIGLEIATVLRADPFEPTALAALFETQAKLGAAQRSLGQQVLLDRITAMTPQERAGFADRLERGMKRGRSKGKKEN